jgi:hypothetical protein
VREPFIITPLLLVRLWRHVAKFFRRMRHRMYDVLEAVLVWLKSRSGCD